MLTEFHGPLREGTVHAPSGDRFKALNRVLVAAMS
jgi:hypothetical protein